jgi:signal transduction histidine kinase
VTASARGEELGPEALAALRGTALFGELADEDLRRLCRSVEQVRLAPGEYLIREGEPGDAMYVVVAGDIEVTKRSGGTERPIDRKGPGTMLGEIGVIDGWKRAASVRAIGELEAVRISREALVELLGSGPDAALALLRTALGRLRELESFSSEQQRLASLGTLAAGLAHELNNPAAAIRRSVEALAKALRAQAGKVPPAGLAGVHPAGPAGRLLGPLERADAVDEMAELVAEPDAAAELVDAGWRADDLRGALAGLDEMAAREAAAWLAASAKVEALLAEVRMAGDRISEIVAAVKSYTYLDRAPAQRVDVRSGLDDTLVILDHKLAGITVRRHYAPGPAAIEAYGSELNQVWTNLLDNAIDALTGDGSIDIHVTPRGDGGVEVQICDDGPGIPSEVLPRLFEPFFTTKPPGAGTGLGLHIAHNVIDRHGGRIEVETAPGEGTCFVVTLPPQPPAVEA